ncbi:hypothetical protein VIGAN_07120000 [Vigna angularis var. angularis]|uniref:Uncharacterized protein n=1 Tax=Vigna angularis var. angularis TaxID=157739 RepID=A0A0S3SI38_PHAAN|nr:uncharacterized protein LOC108333731 [Vigna angularis]BAT92471.1 hypothetical protein VIGAN_07120000 [Vigna angularis var. angularis]
MGGGVKSAVAKFTATGIRSVVPPVQSSVQSASEVSPADCGEDSTARVVSGSVPCFDEATTELKHALHKKYLSSNSTEYQGFALPNQISVLSPSHSGLKNKDSVFQAFQLFSESSEAQNVVASIACDPNVWNAMVQNPKLQDFFHAQQTDGFEVERSFDEKVEDLPYSYSVYSLVNLLNILRNVKFTVVEMIAACQFTFRISLGS